MAYQYLFDPNKQFQNVAGTNNVAGFLRVFYNGTDDRAVTYKYFNGTENPADIPIDNNGRAVVIVNEDMVYRLEVYNRDGALLWSQYPLVPMGGGGGSIGGNTFVANYHETPFSEINAAKNSGMNVVLRMGPPFLNLIASGPEKFVFCALYKPELDSGIPYSFIAEVTSDDEWNCKTIPILYPGDNTLDYDMSSGALKTQMQSTTVKSMEGYSDRRWFKVAEMDLDMLYVHDENCVALKIIFEIQKVGLGCFTQDLDINIRCYHDVDLSIMHNHYNVTGALTYDWKSGNDLKINEIKVTLSLNNDNKLWHFEIWANIAGNDTAQNIVAKAIINERYEFYTVDWSSRGYTRQPWKLVGYTRLTNMINPTPGQYGYYEVIGTISPSSQYDSALDADSTNAVQNSTLYSIIHGLETRIAALGG